MIRMHSARNADEGEKLPVTLEMKQIKRKREEAVGATGARNGSVDGEAKEIYKGLTSGK